MKLSRPQTWNRYVYTENNPLAYIDEDGTSDDGGGDDGGGGGGAAAIQRLTLLAAPIRARIATHQTQPATIRARIAMHQTQPATTKINDPNKQLLPVPSTAPLGVQTYLGNAFYNAPPDVQVGILYHELKHGVGYGPEIDPKTVEGYMQEYQQDAQKCSPQEGQTQTSTVPDSIPGP